LGNFLLEWSPRTTREALPRAIQLTSPFPFCRTKSTEQRSFFALLSLSAEVRLSAGSGVALDFGSQQIWGQCTLLFPEDAGTWVLSLGYDFCKES
jgi:hypothetical protein